MSVGYCHIEHGCKLAATGLRGANGIARGKDGLYFVANDKFGEIFILELQDDHSLVMTDTILTGASSMMSTPCSDFVFQNQQTCRWIIYLWTRVACSM
jgi:hypothetical protein